MKGSGFSSVFLGRTACAVPLNLARKPAGLGVVASLAVRKSSVFVSETNPRAMVKFGLKPEKPTNAMPVLAPLRSTLLRRLSAATLKMTCAVAGSKPLRSNASR